MISKIFSLRNYIMKQLMKTNKEGIIKIPEPGKVDFGEMIIRENLFKKGIDPKTVTSERQLDNILNTPHVASTKPKKTGEVIDVDFDKGRWKDTDPEDFAGGGIAGLRERTGYQRGGPPGGGDPGMTYTAPSGKYITKKKYPPSLSSPILREENRRAQEEAAFESMWRGAPPSMGEREKMFRKARTARLLEEERIKNFEKKINEREKLYPYANMTEAEFAKLYPKIYDFMKKDPAWDWETFQKVSFANPGETYQATGASDIGLPLGRTDTKNLDLFMTPFGEDTYEMSSEGPFNKKKIMSDQDKAQVALHEMRHKKILTEPLLTEAQPPLAAEVSKLKQSGMIRDYPGAHQKMPLMYRHANPPGSKEEFSSPLDMHEVFTRFMDRKYGHLKTPSGPYFDKIWRDEWQPYADKYEKILTEYDLSPVNLAVGGRASTGLNYLLGEDDQNSRMPFKDGHSAGRRKFLKTMAGLASIPFLGKFFKWAKPAAKIADVTSVPIGNAAGMPAWFKPLVNRVIKEGTDVTKQNAYKERVVVHKTKLPESKTEVYVHQDLDSGDVWVDIGIDKHGFPDGHLGQPVRLEYKASELIEPTHVQNIKRGERFKETGKPTKTKEEFWVEEAEFTGGHPENVKFEESTIQKFGEHGSDFTEVEKFATGKVKKVKPTKKKLRTEYESGKAEADAERWTDEVDMASGGRVPLVKGKIAKGLGELVQKLTKEKARTKRISGNLRFENQKRTSIGKPKLSEDEYNYYRELLDDEENYFVMGDETKEMLEAMVKEADAEMNYMYRLYKKGALDPTPGEQTRGRLKMLDDKAQSGVNMTTEEIEELKILSDMRDKLALGGRVPLREGKKPKYKKNPTDWWDLVGDDLDPYEWENILRGIGALSYQTGGRVRMLFGGGIFKTIIKNLAKAKGVDPSTYLKVTNYKALPNHVKKYITPEDYRKMKEGRIEMFETWLEMAKSRQRFLKSIEEGKKGSPHAAPVFEHLEKSFKSPVPHGVTDKDILQGEFILKNLKTKGRKLNATGGRVPLAGGKIVGTILSLLKNKKKVRAAVDDIFPTGDYKYDAEIAAEALVENNPKVFGGKLLDDLDDATRMEIYGTVLRVVQSDLAKTLQLKRLSRPTKTLEGIEKTGTINISDEGVADEFTRFMKETDPKGHKKIEEIVEITNFDPKGRKKNASGGLAGMLGE